MAAMPRDATQIRVVATDDDLAPQHWIAVTPPRIPRAAHPAGRRRLEASRYCWTGWSDWRSRVSGRSGITTVSVEVPKWRILPDRFGAEANSPVMDNNGGGPLGVTELLLRPNTVRPI